MLVHTVLFWLKEEMPQEKKAIFEQNLSKLKQISSVENVFIGEPAMTTKRPVIDDSYDYCLTVILKDIAAHDLYQQDPIHLEFIERCSQMWKRVVVYDAE